MPLPRHCPHCAGEIEETGVVSQYQTKISEPRVEQLELRIQTAGARTYQQRRPRVRWVSQEHNLGAWALALAILLNKGLGLAYDKTSGGIVPAGACKSVGVESAER